MKAIPIAFPALALVLFSAQTVLPTVANADDRTETAVADPTPETESGGADFLSSEEYDWDWSNDTFRPAEFHEKGIEPFLGEPIFETSPVFEEGRFPNILVAMDGTLIAVWGHKETRVRRSEDGGETWGEEITIRKGPSGGGATVDEVTGDILVFGHEGHPPAPLHLYRSTDVGKTWTKQDLVIHPNSLGHVLTMHMNENGITLRRGRFKGRLICPARWYGRMIYQKDFPTHYTAAIFSDDGGKTWMSSEPFPEWGTGEACVEELSDGTLHYNTRRHWAPRREDSLWRYTGESTDAGATWKNAKRSAILPDGEPARAYGLMGGLVRLPVLGRDVLLFSNIDHPDARRNGYVWASFDGGETWPVRRHIFDGHFAYSAMNAGRPGTPSEGWIYLFYEGGPKGGKGTFARFNLSWILDGEATGDGTVPEWVRR